MTSLLHSIKVNLVKTSFLLTSIILLWVTSNISFGKNDWRGILESDAKGYYAYLPAVFIYNDLNFNFFNKIEKEKYFQDHLFYDYRGGGNGKYINKYYCGVAVAQLPFFITAHLLTQLTRGEVDGYSKCYMLSVPLAAWFYCCFGLLFLIGLLRLYDIKETSIALLILACAFGTHLFIYTISEVGMSHVYSFAFISGFLFYTKKYFNTHESIHLYKLSILFGMIVLCRPVNGLILLFLFPLAGSFPIFKRAFIAYFSKVSSMVLSLLLVFAVLSIQFIIYKISTGKFWVYSYQDEGFNFIDPHFIDILFSYKKGLFLYTPILFIGLLSVISILPSKRYFSVSWLLSFGLITYVFSSWWMWFYGGSFSARVYIEYIPLFMLPIGLALDSFAARIKKITVVVIFLLIAVCQVQSYQYRYYDIHYSEMDKARYWNVFLMRNKF